MQLLGRKQREALAKIDAHLVPENAARSGTSAVGSLASLLEHGAQ